MLKTYPMSVEWARKLEPLKDSPQWQVLLDYLQHQESLNLAKIKALQPSKLDEYALRSAQGAAILRFIGGLRLIVDVAVKVMEMERKKEGLVSK